MGHAAGGGLAATQLSVNGSPVDIVWTEIVCRPGQMLIARAMVQLTNDGVVPVGVGSLLITGSGVPLVPATMENVTPAGHHKVFSRDGFLSGAHTNGLVRVMLRVWAVSDSSSLPPLVVDYGRIDLVTVSE